MAKNEEPISQPLMSASMVESVLAAASGDTVLIGGQALAYWLSVYKIDVDSAAPPITRDVDFFTPDASNRKPLARFANAIKGEALYAPKRSITALIGMAVLRTEDGPINVDLVHQVLGLSKNQVLKNAVPTSLPGGSGLLVMSPLDVLSSRFINFHRLKEKRDGNGLLQINLSTRMVREFLSGNQIDAATLRRHTSTIIRLARTSSGRRNAERYGVFVADAIPFERIEEPEFWARQWPRIADLVSPSRRQEVDRSRSEPPAPIAKQSRSTP